MQYHEAVNYLDGLPHSRPKLGTETTASMLEHLGWRPGDVDFVQVAGSNGKGSTARMLESVLREAGLTVGLYTSPDLDDVRERVRVDGRKVPKSTVRSFVEDIDPKLEALRDADDEPTFFEVVTALALSHFADREVDVAVLEVGIGGRYDATSVVDPVASAVTTVSLEHTDLLGDDVAEIARDKASVAADANPLVTAATGEARRTLADVADVLTVGEAGADVTVAERPSERADVTAVAIDGADWHVETDLPLLGAHQARNAGVAAALARQVADVTETDLERGLRRAHFPGRFEVVGRDPLVVLDGAHNPEAVATLATLLDRFDYDALHVVFGAMTDKDHAGMAAALPAADSLTLCEPDVERAEDPEVLASAFESAAERVETVPSVLEATERALDRSGPDDCVIVAGSLSTVAEARDRWTRPQVPVRTETPVEAAAVLETANVPATASAVAGDHLPHRTIRTFVRNRQLDALQTAATNSGVTMAVSGIEATDEHRDVVLSGTLAAMRSLADAIADEGRGLGHLASQLRDRLEDDTREYPWGDPPAIMGILNVTPDSFHDGGEYDAVEKALERAERLVEDGADVIDVGGESTRPGADPVPAEAEIERVVPVIERVADLEVPISIDTRKAEVARAALEAGADIVNDVSGLEDPDLPRVAAEYDAPVIVMHSIDTPVDPELEVEYDDVVADILEELTERVLQAERAGLDREQIVLDPGLGFGTTPAEDFELVDRIDEFHALGCPVLVGHSHKSMFGAIECESGERLPPTVAVTTMAAERGVDVIRVHDVAENAAAVRAVEAVRGDD